MEYGACIENEEILMSVNRQTTCCFEGRQANIFV